MHRAALISITAVAACGGHAPPRAHHGGDPTSEIRGVDWQNRTYDLGDLGSVAVKGGTAEFAITEDGKAAATGVNDASFHVEPPLYADVNGDGVEDVVISSVTATGGTGHFSQVEIFTIRDHQVAALGAIAGGDRGDGGIRKVRVDGRAVIVERNVLAEGDGACCASQFQVERWIWSGRPNDGSMVEDAPARIPPAPIPES